MSGQGDRRFKERMVRSEKTKVAEERREEQKSERKFEGSKFDHHKHN